MLGRIYPAFIDVKVRDALLVHLSDKSRSIGCSATNINHGEAEQQFLLVKDDSLSYASNEVISVAEMAETRDVDSGIQFHFMREPKDIFNSQVEKQPVYDDVIKFENYILVKVPDIWPLIQSGFTNEALRILSNRSTMSSAVVVELRKLFSESGTSINGASPSPLEFHRCLKFFSLKQFVCHGAIRQLRAELSIPNNDSEHPLPFVSGLPVGIECEITLHNIASENKL